MMIRRLTPDDALEFVALRRNALAAAPQAFAASPEDDVAGSLDYVRGALGSAEQAVFGAFDPDLVGSVGIYRDRHVKAAHKCHLWGMWVAPDSRRKGIGRRLVDEAVDFARRMDGVTHVHLSVSEAAEEALALYRCMGFTTWAIEPAALKVGGKVLSEQHMVRLLTP
jgi:ribosomal protein S18 acetylase RimI-like enzyme